MSSHKDKLLRDMQGSEQIPAELSRHLAFLRSMGPDGAEAANLLTADMIETFTSESGLRVLKLFEKAVLQTSLKNGASDGALRESNAVRNFVLDLRRIVANG